MNMHSAGARRRLPSLAAALLALVALSIAPAAAQEYPSQAIRIIVPYPPAGSTDIVARRYADFLSKDLGQSVIIENRPGASTNIGNDAVAAARPDGYTLLFGANGLVQNPVFGPIPSFDPMKSLDPISLVARLAFLVAANPKTPFSSAKELIVAAKAAPGKLSISSAQLEIYVELMKNRAEIDLLHIPYKGGAPATTDAISGQVDMVYALVPVLLPHVQSGRLKALGITSGKRVETLPAVPTFGEIGIDYHITIWFGLLAPAGTPKRVIDRLARATQQIVAHADFAQRLRATGVEAVSSQPDEFRAEMHNEAALWQKLARLMPSLVQTNPTK
ncbi:MAG: tripartite tricarboxylate transporter substrate binding protein [Betaproteobacteria bacterium]|nr:tripartite tricarboxylate transporter substrate binding protein [Betaproteobacteria bacterium]